MEVNSISGIICHVEDFARATEVYDTIGFRKGKEEPDRVTFYVNWFFVSLVAQDRTEPGARGPGCSSTSGWMTSSSATKRRFRRD